MAVPVSRWNIGRAAARLAVRTVATTDGLARDRRGVATSDISPEPVSNRGGGIDRDRKVALAHMLEAVIDMSDAQMMTEVVRLPDGGALTLPTWLSGILADMHEHLGQAIAYARMNGVVPPWTARQQAGRP